LEGDILKQPKEAKVMTKEDNIGQSYTKHQLRSNEVLVTRGTRAPMTGMREDGTSYGRRSDNRVLLGNWEEVEEA
jgi:hypothetical protein